MKKQIFFLASLLFSVSVFSQVVFNNTFEFTNCGQEGMYGPDQTQVNNEYTGTSLDGQVISNDGIQEWVVPFNGLYNISISGSQGAGNSGLDGGLGAGLSGSFSLEQGFVLNVLVGQQGVSDGGNGGGGGGSFVVANGVPLIIAAGGGGLRMESYQNGCNGMTDVFGGGTDEINSGTNSCENSSTEPGNGGQAGYSDWGDGGGGFYSSGEGDDISAGGGGLSYLLGGVGGEGTATGGFGCGGSGNGSAGGGGGGGYTGGDGGHVAGGGGSYNNGDSQEVLSFNEGHEFPILNHYYRRKLYTIDLMNQFH